MADVFISYKNADREKASALAEALKAESISVWWDTHLEAGSDWLRKIVSEVDAAHCLIGVWSRNAIDEDGFFRESESLGHNFIGIEHQRAGPKKVIGALFDAAAIPILYADRQCARLTDWSLIGGSHPEFLKLVDAISARVSAQAGEREPAVNLFQVATPGADSEIVERKFSAVFQSNRQSDWTIAEACVAILMSAAGASGMGIEDEVATASAILRRSRSLRRLSPNQLANANSIAEQRLAQRPDALREACSALPRDMRMSIFAHSANVGLSDGGLGDNEAAFLNKLAQLMELDRADVDSTVRVLSVMNRF